MKECLDVVGPSLSIYSISEVSITTVYHVTLGPDFMIFFRNYGLQVTWYTVSSAARFQWAECLIAPCLSWTNLRLVIACLDAVIRSIILSFMPWISFVKLLILYLLFIKYFIYKNFIIVKNLIINKHLYFHQHIRIITKKQ